MMHPWAKAIDSAVSYLRDHQRETGEFAVYISQKSARMDGELAEVPTPFGATFTIHALRHVDHPDVRPMIEKACKYLVNTMTPSGLWFYMPDPALAKQWGDLWADADDTACCAHALLSNGISPPTLANNKPILLDHRDSRGLFLTWIDYKTRPPGNDVDTVVLSNVLLYLGDTPETRPAIDYLNQIIESNAEQHSYWYYLDHLTLYYMLTRAMRNGVTRLERSKPFIVERTLRRRERDGGFGSDLQTALAIATLHNCDAQAEVGAAVEALAKRQHGDGSWTSEAFYAAQKPPLPGTFVFWCGSADLVTALCLEALSRSAKVR
jgi:hypothetical protein